MKLYRIFMIHNRAWSELEILCFAVIISVCIFLLIRAVYFHKLKRYQAAAILALIVYLGIVFASTVFTRTPTIRQYRLLPFWSWIAVIKNHNMALLQENILNCLLLLPVGALLPAILGSRVRPSMAFLSGFFIAAVIESCQLIFKRGLFEWDDMLHNGLGCMFGCLVINAVIKYWKKRQYRKKRRKLRRRV